MSWICENCSSVNESDASVCFVCGTERSKESYLQEKREQRAARFNAIGDFLIKKVYLGIEIALIAVAVILFAALIIAIFTGVYKGFGERLSAWGALVWQNMSSVIPARIGQNAVQMGKTIAENCALLPPFFAVLAQTVSANAAISEEWLALFDFSQKTAVFSALGERIALHGEQFTALFGLVADGCKQRFAQAAEFFGNIAAKFKK